MLAIVGMMSVTSGTCLACAGSKTSFERHTDLVGGVLLMAGLVLIGALLPGCR